MEWMIYFLIFCASLSMASCVLWFSPLVQEAKLKGVVNTFTKHPIYSAIIYCVLSTVVAPFLILPMFSKEHEKKLIVGLRKEIHKPD